MALLLILAAASPVYALNIFERIKCKEATIKAYGQKILVSRLTGKVKYIWQEPTSVMIYGKTITEAQWMPIYDKSMEKMWQDLYDQERAK